MQKHYDITLVIICESSYYHIIYLNYEFDVQIIKFRIPAL